MSDKPQEVPYSLAFEGRIRPENIPELIETVGRLSTEMGLKLQAGEQAASAETEPAEPLLATLYEFQDIAKMSGFSGGMATRAWNELYSNFKKQEDFPVRFKITEPSDRQRDIRMDVRSLQTFIHAIRAFEKMRARGKTFIVWDVFAENFEFYKEAEQTIDRLRKSE